MERPPLPSEPKASANHINAAEFDRATPSSSHIACQPKANKGRAENWSGCNLSQRWDPLDTAVDFLRPQVTNILLVDERRDCEQLSLPFHAVNGVANTAMAFPSQNAAAPAKQNMSTVDVEKQLLAYFSLQDTLTKEAIVFLAREVLILHTRLHLCLLHLACRNLLTEPSILLSYYSVLFALMCLYIRLASSYASAFAYIHVYTILHACLMLTSCNFKAVWIIGHELIDVLHPELCLMVMALAVDQSQWGPYPPALQQMAVQCSRLDTEAAAEFLGLSYWVPRRSCRPRSTLSHNRRISNRGNKNWTEHICWCVVLSVNPALFCLSNQFKSLTFRIAILIPRAGNHFCKSDILSVLPPSPIRSLAYLARRKSWNGRGRSGDFIYCMIMMICNHKWSL